MSHTASKISLSILLALATSYFIFAILLNSVGTVILQSINSFNISKPEASTLEGFKDLSIALVSFLVASYIPKMGYKKALITGLLLATLGCLIVLLYGEFIAIQLMFAAVGTGFAFVKIAVYSIIGQVTHSVKGHASLLNTIEGIFMLGVLSGYWLFSSYVDGDSLSWLNVYLPLVILLLATLGIVAMMRLGNPSIAENDESSPSFVDMLKLTYKPLVIVFVISIFMYVLIEQGIGTWLPTFNHEVLNIPADISIQITSIFAAALAVGRLLAGQLLKLIDWYKFLNICLALMGVLILVTVPAASGGHDTEINSIAEIPKVAFILPLLGLMMAPIYPVLNSIMLSALEKSSHAMMTGLIVVFSALGGTTGSLITGVVFEYFGGQQAFLMTLIPIILLIVSMFVFRRMMKNFSADIQDMGGNGK